MPNPLRHWASTFLTALFLCGTARSAPPLEAQHADPDQPAPAASEPPPSDAELPPKDDPNTAPAPDTTAAPSPEPPSDPQVQPPNPSSNTPPPAAATSAPASTGVVSTADAISKVPSGQFHVFEKNYLFAGFSFQWPETADGFSGTIRELEVSFVPLISDTLAWLGLWLGAGLHGAPNDNWSRHRFGGGLEFGYRFAAADVGIIHDDSEGWGFRGRIGPALALELTTPRYSPSCCPSADARFSCECDRTVCGISIFPFWAIEEYFDDADARDGMFGISIKGATGF